MKKFLAVMLAAIMLLSLAACGKKEAKVVDVSALAKDIVSQVTFDSEMIPMDADELEFNFGVPEDAAAAGYIADSVTTEIVVCVQCADEGAATAVKALMQAYVLGLADNADKYDPTEAQRVANGTYLEQTDNLTVLVIASDVQNVASVIEGYTK